MKNLASINQSHFNIFCKAFEVSCIVHLENGKKLRCLISVRHTFWPSTNAIVKCLMGEAIEHKYSRHSCGYFRSIRVSFDVGQNSFMFFRLEYCYKNMLNIAVFARP